MNSAVLKRKFTGKPVTIPYSAANQTTLLANFSQMKRKMKSKDRWIYLICCKTK